MNKNNTNDSLASTFLDIDWSPKPYEIVFFVFGAITTILLWMTPLPFSYRLGAVFVMKVLDLIGFVYALSIAVIAYRAIKLGRTKGWSALRDKNVILELIQPYWTLNYLALTFRRGFAVLGVVFFFLHLKHVILFLHFANYDLFFWNLDRFLHFGVQPNVYLMENFGANHNFAITMDWLYIKYFKYKMIVSAFFLLELFGRKLTEKFFLGYALLWAIGGLGYLVMPTDGPCYAILAPYSVPAEHSVHKFKFPVVDDIPEDYARNYYFGKFWTAKHYQNMLWEHRKKFLMGERLPGAFYGIAAMPSLHVAAVVLFMLFMFNANTLFGTFGAVYAIVIFTGSIFLQWHYAVDGYVGAMMAIGIWRLCQFQFWFQLGKHGNIR